MNYFANFHLNFDSCDEFEINCLGKFVVTVFKSYVYRRRTDIESDNMAGVFRNKKQI